MGLPWEVGAGALPWETAGYTRTISITRIVNSSVVGALAYQGATQAPETTLATGIPASIELASAGRNSASGAALPGDSAGPLKYSIFVPASSPLPILQERDIIYDDLISPSAPNGRRFQVDGWTPVPQGFRIDCLRLLT